MRRRLACAAVGAALLVAAGSALAGFGANASSADNVFSAAPDLTPPVVADAVIGKEAGGAAGVIRRGGSYYVYASAGDSGNPASGLAGAVADVSGLTPSAGSPALAAGSFTAGGVAYNRRSALLTADAALAAGTRSFGLTLTDAAGNAATSAHPVLVDNTAPTASDIQTQNGGLLAGRTEVADRVIFSFSEAIEPISILGGWGGAATPVVVRITNNTGNDRITVRNAANSSQLPLGTVALGQNYVTSTTNFGATGTASSMVIDANTIVVTLGTPSSASAVTVATSSTMVWTPSTTATDLAGNTLPATTRNETGASDREF